MRELEAWLTPRLAKVPRTLRERILSAVRSESGELGVGPSSEGTTPDSPLPVLLATHAESLLREAKSGPPTRETALTLLAADALITFAMEAEAEA